MIHDNEVRAFEGYQAKAEGRKVMGSLGKLAPPNSAMRPSGLPAAAGSRPPSDSLHQD
jgi:hypothetical protein